MNLFLSLRKNRLYGEFLHIVGSNHSLMLQVYRAMSKNVIQTDRVVFSETVGQGIKCSLKKNVFKICFLFFP